MNAGKNTYYVAIPSEEYTDLGLVGWTKNYFALTVFCKKFDYAFEDGGRVISYDGVKDPMELFKIVKRDINIFLEIEDEIQYYPYGDNIHYTAYTQDFMNSCGLNSGGASTSDTMHDIYGAMVRVLSSLRVLLNYKIIPSPQIDDMLKLLVNNYVPLMRGIDISESFLDAPPEVAIPMKEILDTYNMQSDDFICYCLYDEAAIVDMALDMWV